MSVFYTFLIMQFQIMNFTMFYSAKASWTWESGSSFVVRDWNIVETGNVNKMAWQFWQKRPWDGRTGASNVDVSIISDLSQNSAQFHAQGIWKTANKISGPVRFNYKIMHLQQMAWGGKTGLTVPTEEKSTPVIMLKNRVIKIS